MEKIFFSLPNNESLAKSLAAKANGKIGEAIIRRFPDGETYVKVVTAVEKKKVVIVCTLDHPDEKLLPLLFLSKTVKELGAVSVCLVAPYLAYMRQDKRFQPGEAITSTYFASLLSSFVDELITIDPHLHRRSSLSEIYSIPTTVVHAADTISHWIKETVENPVLIGPDSESEQWVSAIAAKAGAPYIILAKTRKGDTEVEVSVPQVAAYSNHTPVLVDDIISTARTMIETIGHLQRSAMTPPVCIGVHGIFAGSAYADLLSAGAQKVVTCNTILHETNGIEVSDLLYTQL